MDDEESFLEVASHFMQKTRGLEVHGATSVSSAMEMMSHTSFDVIVSDYQMPETDGIDFLKMVRARGSDIPFILFTGKGRESVVIEALNQGADFYLQKGGDLRSQFHELASMISQAVQSRRASTDLVESRERFRGLADTISDLLVGLDDDFRVTFWNKAAEEVLKIKSAEAIGMTAFDIVPLIKNTPVEDALRNAATSRHMKSAMIDMPSENDARTFDIGVYPGVEGLLVFARDITDTKAAAQLLAESEERYKALVEAAPNAIIVFVIDTIVFANPAAVRIYGGDDESDLIGKRIFDLIAPEFVDESAARIRKMYEDSVPDPPWSLKIYTKTGPARDMSATSIPITFSGRKAILTILRDITEENRAETLLRANQEELRTIIDSVPLMISYQDVEGRFLRVNMPFAEVTGMDEKRLRGRKVEDVLPGFGELFSLRDKKVIETRRPLIGAVTPYRAKHGVRWARTDKIPYVDDAGEVMGVLTVAEDITDKIDSERKLARQRVMLDTMDDPVIFSDSNYGIDFWNRAAEKTYGFSAEEVMGRNALEVLETDFLQNDRDEMLKRVIEEGHVDMVFRQKRKDGEWIHVECTTVCLKDAEDTVVGFGSINRDISERIRAEEELRESKEAAERYLEIAADLIISMDVDGDVVLLNRSGHALLGYQEGELIGRNWFDTCLPRGVRAETRELFDKLMLGGGEDAWSHVNSVLTKNGDERTILWHNTLLYDASGEVSGVLSSGGDITELNKAEEAASRANEQLEHLLSESSAVTYSCNAEDPFDATYVSPNIKRMYGHEPEEFFKNPGFWASMIHPDDSERVFRELQEIFEKGYHVHEYRWKREDGTYTWIHDELRLIRNGDGEPIQMVGLWLDIADRKKVEAERETERRDFSLILDSAPLLVFYKDEEGKVILVNKAFAEALGMPREEIVGKTASDLFPSDMAQGMTDDDQEVLRSGRPKLGIIERYESAEGIRWVQTEKIPVKDEAGNSIGLVGFAQDVTERKKTEEALRESEEAFKSLAENSPYGVLIGDGKGGVLYVNKRMVNLTGYSVDELLNLSIIENLTRPEDRESLKERMKERMEGDSQNLLPFERVFLRKDGTEVLTDLVPSTTMWKGKKRPLCIVHDITERKKAEEGLKMVNKKLNLLGGITRHDSLNQLTVLKGWLSTAIEQEGDDSVRDMLLKVEKASDSLKMHLDFTAQYKSLGMKRPGWMPLAEVAAKVTEGLGRQGISVSVEVEDVEIFADPMLENVFRNLVNNSIAHGDHVDSISFSCEEGKDGLAIIYEDNGVGISAEEKAKIFARGYGKRHGYGLYLSWEILSITGMTLKETGIPTEGVRFEISVLPGNYRRKSE
ncbi:MAG: PAS domain S-box protein [Candidatus Thermoplasmatota archaeon]|nr:PAS domain S-box protein [Candidatus Thermoplasmatota archaeon]